MATLIRDDWELSRRTHAFEAKTQLDRAGFAAWVITIGLLMAGSLALGLASASW